ncbi:MAG: hypothetical protein Q4G34_01300 [Micrococcus sp.]|nr:hypothetical protein [Micrococcus sp.]
MFGIGSIDRPGLVDVPVGDFTVSIPGHWGLVSDGTRDGLMVLDPLPDEPSSADRLVTANVVLRHFPWDGGVGDVAAREARPPAELETPSMTLSFDHGWSQSGLSFRRHHLVMSIEGHAVHSIRWYAVAAGHAFECTLTFDDEQIADDLGTVCDDLMDSLCHSGDNEAGDTAPSAAAMRERDAPVIAPVRGSGQAVLELLEWITCPTRLGRVLTWSELSVGQRAFLERNRPVLIAEGLRHGRHLRIEAYREQRDAMLVIWQTTPGVDPEESEPEYVALSSLLVPYAMLALADLQAGWTRDVRASAPIDPGTSAGHGAWDVAAGGERGISLLHGLRNPWLVVDVTGAVVAEWCASDRASLFAVFRDDDAQQLTVAGVDGWTLYVRILASWVAGVAV